MLDKSICDTIGEHLRKDEIEDALELLNKNGAKNDSITYSAWFKRIKKQKRIGNLSNEEYQRHSNQIINGLVELLDEVCKEKKEKKEDEASEASEEPIIHVEIHIPFFDNLEKTLFMNPLYRSNEGYSSSNGYWRSFLFIEKNQIKILEVFNAIKNLKPNSFNYSRNLSKELRGLKQTTDHICQILNDADCKGEKLFQYSREVNEKIEATKATMAGAVKSYNLTGYFTQLDDIEVASLKISIQRLLDELQDLKNTLLM